ncbi:MAG: ISNCY family transposase [Candidatus Omnitrophica bacterium]|nr:ISNCY family transposase [Candidatus Omnitrophota bacterium]
MREVLRMTGEESRRLYVIQQVLERKIRQRQAAELLGRSVRQIRRLVQRVRQDGPRGIGHRLRGRRSNRRHADTLQQRVVALYRAHYADFGPTLAREKLAERHRLHLGRETLRRWLGAAGLWHGQRQTPRHHQWRERKACVGEMVQVDGSHHDWLEGRGPWLVLMGYIDDATNRVFARFYDYEGPLPALDSFARYARRYGLPQRVYVDRHTTYQGRGKPTRDDELAGRTRPQSQFERALAELGVEVIPAYSPQAKGRVERLFGTFQDRLVKELRLAHVTTREAAHRFLEAYLPRHNRQFCRGARSPVNLHRPCPPAHRLRRILAIRHPHVLRNDNTVQHETATYLVQERWNGHRPKTIEAEVRLDGKLHLLAGNQVLHYRQLPARPVVTPPPSRPPSRRRARTIPAADHPWRQFERVQRLTALKNRTFLLGTNEDISIGR